MRNQAQYLVNSVFDLCVKALEILAKRVGMSYEEVNIWIFCIIEPVVFVVMLFIIIRMYYKIKLLKIIVDK